MSVIVKAISMLFIEYYRPKEIELDKISRYPAYEEYAPHGEEKTDKYFTFNKDMKTVTLDRGEIVSIGMNRDFDLSVTQAAFGTVMNSSAWPKLVSTGKESVVITFFELLDNNQIDAQEALSRIQKVLAEIGENISILIGRL